jgi:nucleoside-diphosphate-sugar epimerase
MNANEGSEIVVWGQGNEERDLLYVSDLVDFLECSLEKQKSKFEIFNAGYGSSISVKKLVERVIAHSGKNVGIRYDLSKPSINTKLCLDITKAKSLLGWAPKISIDEGIKKTIKWYKNYAVR